MMCVFVVAVATRRQCLSQLMPRSTALRAESWDGVRAPVPGRNDGLDAPCRFRPAKPAALQGRKRLRHWFMTIC